MASCCRSRWCTERLGGGGDHQQQDADTTRGMRVTNHVEPRLSLATFNLRPVPWCGSVCAVQRVAKRVPRLHEHPHAVTEMRQVGKYTMHYWCPFRDRRGQKIATRNEALLFSGRGGCAQAGGRVRPPPMSRYTSPQPPPPFPTPRSAFGVEGSRPPARCRCYSIVSTVVVVF